MQRLIEGTEMELIDEPRRALLDFVRVKREPTPEKKQPEVIKPPAPEKQPPRPEPTWDGPSPGPTIPLTPPPVGPVMDSRPTLDGVFAEGDYLPIVKVAPIYPQRALSRGTEGYCTVEYTVTRQGTIRDPFVVPGQCTSSLFERASIQAALKFKYKPRVIDGQPIEVPGVQNRFRFEIGE
ncbi:TonB family protein [Marinihelvus fidelis]|uniref:TonB family protein n=2 Tax=Marinihelvus fidelis TaxID=2613842 RepID=A0A5N0T815_9GAMM|nr:TonB family protein [Marinihelvus fidelis]